MLALGIVALWAFAEATLFFIVADVPIMAIGIRYDTRRALVAALVAAIFAAFGGLIMMEWASAAPEASRAAIEGLPGIDAALYDEAARSLEWPAFGWAVMMEGAFRGMPFKLYAHAAGVGGASMASFFLGSVLARLPRFLLVAVIASLIGPPLRRHLPGRRLWLVFALAWTAFYAWYFAVMAR
jgi:membrane protein YqaA with SNARE-associated domain